jgi:hypothetical protein
VCLGKIEAYAGFLVGKPEGNSLVDTGVGGRIILRWIFRKWDVGYGLVRAGSEQVAGT